MAKKEENNKGNEKNKKSFFKDFKAELKRVTWPTPKQLVNNTIAVITIVLITVVIVFILDFAFESLNKYGVNRIKSSMGTLSEEDSYEDDMSEGISVDENGGEISIDEDEPTEKEDEEDSTAEDSENSGETDKTVTEDIQSVE